MTLPSVFGRVIAASEDLKRLDKASKALEADLFKRFLKEASPKGGMFGDSSKTPGSDIYGDMGRDALADTLSKQGTLGVGRAIFASLAPTIVAQTHVAAPPMKTAKSAGTANADLATTSSASTNLGTPRS